MVLDCDVGRRPPLRCPLRTRRVPRSSLASIGVRVTGSRPSTGWIRRMRLPPFQSHRHYQNWLVGVALESVRWRDSSSVEVRSQHRLDCRASLPPRDGQENETSRKHPPVEELPREDRAPTLMAPAMELPEMCRMMTGSIAAQSRRLTRPDRPRASANSLAIFTMKDLLKRPRMAWSGSMYQERSTIS